MTTDKRPPGFQETDEDLELGAAPLTDAELDAWIYRTRHALNESIRKGREEYARGETRPGDEVFEEILAKLRTKD